MVNCTELVDSVVNAATDRFGSTLKENKENKTCLRSYCEAIDKIAKSFGCIMFGAEVHEITTDITIEMICEEFEITDMNGLFFNIVERAKEVRFGSCQDKNVDSSSYIHVSFTFGGIWERSI